MFFMKVHLNIMANVPNLRSAIIKIMLICLFNLFIEYIFSKLINNIQKSNWKWFIAFIKKLLKQLNIVFINKI